MLMYANLLLNLALFLITCGGKSRFAYSITHQSHLCKRMDMPCAESIQKSECWMKYYKINSTDCRDLTFSHNSDFQGIDDLGLVQLRSYYYDSQSYKQTGFNVTFTNISWSTLKFRFKQEGNEIKNTCREFHRSANSTIKTLFYDCLWSNETYEGKPFIFEYEMSKDNVVAFRKYYFQVPLVKNLDESAPSENWEIFVYTEVYTNVFGKSTIVLHWIPLPEKYSIDTYNVIVYSNESAQPVVMLSTNVTCNDNKECTFQYNKWFGNVQFGIQPVSSTNSHCLTSKTIVFHLGMGILGRENSQSLLIGIVSITLIIPAFAYIFFLMRNYFVRKTKTWVYSIPKLLVIFSPSSPSHADVVIALVEYLEKYCNVEPLIDELHIYRSESKDPFKWCNDAIKSADFVMVIPSPTLKNVEPANSVYRRTGLLLLRLMKERLSLKSQKTNYFVLMLPYCSESDVPEEAVHLTKFFFPKDLNKMLKYIHKDNMVSPFFASSKIQGGKSTYKLFGKKLNDAIAQTHSAISSSRVKTGLEEDKGITKYEKSDRLLLLGPLEAKKEERELKNLKEKKYDGGRLVAVDVEAVFKAFPGRLDDMNLSGDETECLVFEKKKGSINLDALDL